VSSALLSDDPCPDAIVAVPVRNEEERIAACLKAWRADRWTALETEPHMVPAE